MSDNYASDFERMEREKPDISGALEYEQVGNVRLYRQLHQRTDEWHALRKGMVTASEIKKILTSKTLKVADNAETRAYICEIIAGKITDFDEDRFESYDMLRGTWDETHMIQVYEANNEPVRPCGFIINEKLGFPVGYSPDGLVGENGLIEGKSRKAKLQTANILNHVAGWSKDQMPVDDMLQCQGALWASERDWLDYISYCGGMPMLTIRVLPDPVIFEKIEEALKSAQDAIDKGIADISAAIADPANRLVSTERQEYDEEMR